MKAGESIIETSRLMQLEALERCVNNEELLRFRLPFGYDYGFVTETEATKEIEKINTQFYEENSSLKEQLDRISNQNLNFQMDLERFKKVSLFKLIKFYFTKSL